jgi:glycosyltransferase involved in cell wall biosynthesis
MPDSPVAPRRVLMTADTVGGVWTYALELARVLAPHGVEVTLATMGAPLSDAQWAEVRALPNVAVEESRFALEWMDSPWEDVRAAGEWLLALEARLRPDVVHLNGYAHGALPWARAPLVVGHSCVLSWWRAVKGEDAPERYTRYQQAVAAGLHAAGRVVAPSGAMLEALQAHYGPLPAADVIYNARSADAFPPGLRREPFILSAGRLWDEAKNVATLAAAAPRLGWPVKVAGDVRHPDGGQAASSQRKPHPPLGPPVKVAGDVRHPDEGQTASSQEIAHWPVKVADDARRPDGSQAVSSQEALPPLVARPVSEVGGTRHSDGARAVSAQEKLPPSVHRPVCEAGDARHSDGTRAASPGVEFLGLLPPPVLARWMARASVYALPARYEPFGLSALEAALSGCALVLGNIPSLREVWADAALFIPPEDVDALVAALELLRRDVTLRTRLAVRARERALTYTPRRMAASYLSVYAGLMGAHAASPTVRSPGAEPNPRAERTSP